MIGSGVVVIAEGQRAPAARRLLHKEFIDDLYPREARPGAARSGRQEGRSSPELQAHRRRHSQESRAQFVDVLRDKRAVPPEALRDLHARRRERRPPLRRGPAGRRQESADRLPGNALSGSTTMTTASARPIDRWIGGSHRRLAAAVASRLRLVQDMFEPSRPDVKFAPYDDDYPPKPDFAAGRVQVSADADGSGAKLTPENLAALDQEQIDQIYARLTAGPIPDGPFDGGILFPRGRAASSASPRSRAGSPGSALQLKGLAARTIGEALWKGKVFYRDERVLRNRIEDLERAQEARSGRRRSEASSPSAARRRGCCSRPSSIAARACSTRGASRSSSTISSPTRFPAIRKSPDFLAGRRGLRVRDEIRMVRPGFYLGRAYIDRVLPAQLHALQRRRREARSRCVRQGRAAAGRLLYRDAAADGDGAGQVTGRFILPGQRSAR